VAVAQGPGSAPLSAGDAAARRGATESPRSWLPARPVAHPARSPQTGGPPNRKPRVRDLHAQTSRLERQAA
jgi:hypothetical protein